MTIDESDENLVIAAQHGDLAAWERLCHKFMPRLAAYLGSRLRRPEIIERLIGEMVTWGWKHLPELDQPQDFFIWLRRAGGGVALQWSRKHPHEPLSAPFPSHRCGDDEDLADDMERVEHALGALTDAQRMVLEQHFRGYMSVYDLAMVMHLSDEAVSALIDEALDALLHQLNTAS
jgi:DNA-directed RNA polymerase specialized sigma24 family protein